MYFYNPYTDKSETKQETFPINFEENSYNDSKNVNSQQMYKKKAQKKWLDLSEHVLDK